MTVGNFTGHKATPGELKRSRVREVQGEVQKSEAEVLALLRFTR